MKRIKTWQKLLGTISALCLVLLFLTFAHSVFAQSDLKSYTE